MNGLPEENGQEEGLTSHLKALRLMLIHCFAALGIMLLPALFLAPSCLDVLLKILLNGQNITLNFFSPAEVFLLQIKLALVIDTLICFPYLAKQVWDFFLPALYEHERKFIRSVVSISAVLFVTGALFCLMLILPLIIRFGSSFATAEIKAVLGISNVVGLSLQLSIIFGLMFQFPLITVALIRADIVPYKKMKNLRPYIFTFILTVAAILTPPDIISQIMLAVPTYGLFEAGLYFSRKYASEK